MKFCTNCDFMFYTRLDKKEKKLIYYCNNCETEEDVQPSSSGKTICVYTKNYSNDFLYNKATTNKYTKFDPTLPRINNMKCINQQCPVHFINSDKIKDDKYNDKNSIYITKNNNEDGYHELDKIELESIKTILKIPADQIMFEDIIDNKYIVLTLSEEIYDNIDEEYNSIINENSYNILKNIDNEIIFIKYDNINLKYLYLCPNCNHNWNNE